MAALPAVFFFVFFGCFFCVEFLIIAAVLIGMYKAFAKIGCQNAWWIFIPVLNVIFFLQFVEKPLWWIVLLFIPCVSIVFGIYIHWLVGEKVARAYGKGTGFAIGLLLAGFVLYPYLGFSKSEQPVAQQGA